MKKYAVCFILVISMLSLDFGHIRAEMRELSLELEKSQFAWSLWKRETMKGDDCYGVGGGCPPQGDPPPDVN